MKTFIMKNWDNKFFLITEKHHLVHEAGADLGRGGREGKGGLPSPLRDSTPRQPMVPNFGIIL